MTRTNKTIKLTNRTITIKILIQGNGVRIPCCAATVSCLALAKATSRITELDRIRDLHGSNPEQESLLLNISPLWRIFLLNEFDLSGKEGEG